jgi:hypothetical protein
VRERQQRSGEGLVQLERMLGQGWAYVE